jgi:hypothetical protein
MTTDMELAKQAAGNWKKFDSFAWFGQPEDGEKWTIIHTRNRDSNLMTQSNAAAIDKRLERFTKGRYPTAIGQSFSHWACGWVEGYAIKVFTNKGEITKAFKELLSINADLRNYPVLDDFDYSEREYKAAISGIYDAAWRWRLEMKDAPDDWPVLAYRWFAENDDRALENTDDTGAYPSEEQMQKCLLALNLIEKDEE